MKTMKIISFDTETAAMIPGNLTPPLVCLTWTERAGDELTKNILTAEDAISWFEKRIKDEECVLVGQNLTFDLGVILGSVPVSHQLELMSDVLKASEDGRISDTMLRESLLLLANGILSADPRDGNRRPLTNLGAIAQRRLGLDLSADKKDPDAWRLRYHELINVPLEFWPEDAVRYAVDDPRIALLCWEHQLEEARGMNYLDSSMPHLVTDEGPKVAEAWALHLNSIWGLRTDPESVQIAAEKIECAGQAVDALLIATGLGEHKTKQGKSYVGQNRKKIQERVALVYAGLSADQDKLLSLSDGVDSDEDSTEELTPEQNKILEAILQDASAIDLPDVSSIPGNLEAYPLARFSWGKPKNAEQEAEVEQHKGMCCFDPEGKIWTEPESREAGIIATKCSGQIIKKITVGGGGIAYRDKETGAIVTPLTAPSKSFPEGQVSWSRETLELSGDQVLVILAALGKVTKLRTTYIPILSHGTKHPIQPRYWLPKETGRTSASGPNVQNLPSFGGIRECFVARSIAEFTGNPELQGQCALLVSDIDQAECVAWSQWCLEEFGFSRMAEVLQEGKDPHLWTAIHFPQLSGMSYEEALKKKKAGDPVVKNIRQYAKSPGVFGWMGGMSAPTLAKAARGYGVEISLEEAQGIIDVLNDTFPEGRYAARWTSERCSGDATFTFTQRLSGRRRGGCGYTDGRNQPFQGGIADLTGDILFHTAIECYTGKLPYIEWEEWKRSILPLLLEDDSQIEHDMVRDGALSPLYGARPWAFIHDEFILETPYDLWGMKRSTEAADHLDKIISDRGKVWFPDVPIRSGAGYARRWIKDRKAGKEIKAVRDVNGLLIPCDDPLAELFGR